MFKLDKGLLCFYAITSFGRFVAIYNKQKIKPNGYIIPNWGYNIPDW